jgi:hypothetical protein
VAVRQLAPPQVYTAYQLAKNEEVVLHDRALTAFAGDWIITLGATVMDVLSPAAFLQRYAEVKKEGLQLSTEQESQLATALGPAALESSSAFTTTIMRLARLRVGDVEINFSAAQWEELARRAEKRRQSVKAYVGGVVHQLLQDLWTGVGV